MSVHPRTLHRGPLTSSFVHNDRMTLATCPALLLPDRSSLGTLAFSARRVRHRLGGGGRRAVGKEKRVSSGRGGNDVGVELVV